MVRSVSATLKSGSLPGASQVARISWRATDKGTGVLRYTVQASRNGGAWKNVKLATPKATVLEGVVATGSKYRFRVRATDRAGNVGAWFTTPIIRPTKIDDRSAKIVWSPGWRTAGSVHTTDGAGRTARLSFTGQAIALVAPRGPGSGWAQVYVDGKLAATVSLQAASPQPPSVVWQRAFGAVRAHTVRVRTLATSGHPTVAIDGFAIFR